MAGNLPPFLAAAAKGKKSGGNKPSADAISRRLKNMQGAKKKSAKKPTFSKSDPDYAQDMAGK